MAIFAHVTAYDHAMHVPDFLVLGVAGVLVGAFIIKKLGRIQR